MQAPGRDVLNLRKMFLFSNIKNFPSNQLTTVYIVIARPKLRLLLLSPRWMDFFKKLMGGNRHSKVSFRVGRKSIGSRRAEKSASENCPN